MQDLDHANRFIAPRSGWTSLWLPGSICQSCMIGYAVPYPGRAIRIANRLGRLMTDMGLARKQNPAKQTQRGNRSAAASLTVRSIGMPAKPMAKRVDRATSATRGRYEREEATAPNDGLAGKVNMTKQTQLDIRQSEAIVVTTWSLTPSPRPPMTNAGLFVDVKCDKTNPTAG